MTGTFKHRILFLSLALCVSLSLCAQHYRIDYAGEGTPAFDVRYYAGEILKEGYTTHQSISFANCFVIHNLTSDVVKDLQIFYAKGEKSVFDTPFDGLPYICSDSAYYTLTSKNRTQIPKDNAGKNPGWFVYPNLKAGLPVGLYQDTLVVRGSFCDNTITFRLYLQQIVAHFTETYIQRGETYSFEGLTLTESGRYRVGTEVLDLHVIEPCEVHIEASATFLKEPGEIQLTTDREGDYYQWSGYGLDAPTVRNPVATIDTDGDKEYKMELTAFTETGPNMASNGNFEEGNTGFHSNYSYLEPSSFGHNKFNPPISPGKYSIVAFPKQVNTPWTGCLHDGYMMVIDGSGKPQTVYAATVSVQPHTYYAFSAEVASVSNVSNKKTQPHIQFFINGETFTEVYEPTVIECDWHKFHRIWYSGDLSGDIDISLLNTQTASSGNDMALDNVSFRELCIAHDELTVKADFTPEPDCDEHKNPVQLTATACDSYTWHDETYTESGVYTWETKTVLGCDSVETLTLTIHPSCLIPDTVVQCDSYTWQGETYTASGDYRKDYQSVYGCDSVLTLNLTIHHSGTGEEEMVEYKEYPWKGQNYTSSGDYRFDTLTTHGCDSLVTLHLTIVDTPFVAGMLPIADLCADDEHLAIEYTLTDVILAPQQVDVSFPNDRLAAVQTDDVSGTVLIPLPDSIRPDYYDGLLQIRYKSYVQQMPFTFLVRYPSTVIGQKWNNVLALKNSRYNGGYLWDAYRWYADNKELVGETQSFIYCGEGKTLLMGHPYHASLRRVGEDYFIPTCPILPAPHEDWQPVPTIFRPGQRVAGRRAGKEGKVTFYDMLGRIVVSGTEVNAPSLPGVYMLETEEGIQKIIVR